MKQLSFLLIIICAFTACKQSTKETENRINSQIENNDNIKVYYFHGKQRCETCVAVGKIAERTVKEEFGDNKTVEFAEINISDNANESLAEKYEVTWNALSIAKIGLFAQKNKVEVLYFKAQLSCCKAASCNKIENEIKDIIKKNFEGKAVGFKQVLLSDQANKALIEKYNAKSQTVIL